jgi:hypothetical protein
MSTRNVKKEADVAIEALTALSEAADARSERARRQMAENGRKLEALHENQNRVLHGAKVALQAIDDNREAVLTSDERLVEELGRLAPSSAAPVADAPEPASIPEQAPAAPTTEDPSASAGEYEEEGGFVEQAATPPATQVVTTPDAPHAAAPEQAPGLHPFNPRSWSVLQWILAILLGILGLAAFKYTVGWWQDLWLGDTSLWEWVRWACSFSLALLWFTALVGGGFFGGGWLGRSISDWRLRRRQQQP